MRTDHGARARPQSRSALLEVLVVSFVIALIGCGGGGGGAPGDIAGTAGVGGLSSTGGNGTITGKITDADTGAGVSGATVSAGGVTATAGSSGSFTLSRVPAGTVMVVASASGLGSKSSVVFLNAGQSLTVNFVLGASAGGGGGSASGTGPVLSSSNPKDKAIDVDPTTQIIFTLDQAVRRSTLSTNIPGLNAGSVVFTKLSTPSVNDSGVSTVSDFGLARTFLYRPGTLAPLQAGTRYGIFLTNRLVGTNGLPCPGADFTFTTRSDFSGSGGGGAITPPRLIYRNPPDKSLDVDPFSRIIFAFDREMNEPTITVTGRNILFSQITPPAFNDSDFSIRKATDIQIANAFEYIGGASVNPLRNFTTYTLFITNGVTSKAGVPSSGESFSFTSKRFDPGSPPVIVSSNPANRTTDIDPSTRIFITLSSNTDFATVTNTSVKLTRLTSPVQELTMNVSVSAPTVEIVGFAKPLDGQATYQVSINNDVRNTAGQRSLGSAISFGTRGSSSSGGGTVIPRLLSSNPSNLATNVDLNTRVLLTFNVAMDLPSLQAPRSVIISALTTPAGELPDTLRVTPSVILNTYEVENSTGPRLSLTSLNTYRVFLSNTIKAQGSSGGFLAPTFFDFRTRFVQGADGDTTKPTLAGSSPRTGATSVDVASRIFFTFSENVVTATVTPSNVSFSQVSGITSSDDRSKARVIPLNTVNVTVGGVGYQVASEYEYIRGSLALSPGQRFQMFLSNGITDPSGNRLDSTGFTFTVANVQETIQGPSVSASNPTSGQLNVDPVSQILFTFDKNIFFPGDTVNVSPTSTVTFTNVIFSRASSPAENDATINVTFASSGLPPDATFRFDATQNTTVVNIPVSSGKDVSTGVTITSLPVIIRPDPVNDPRTFRYIPGRLPLQAGVVRYALFVTNRVRDSAGIPAQGDVITFTTRDSTTSPAAGPRLLAANPATGTISNGSARIFLTFDKPILASSIAGSPTPAFGVRSAAFIKPDATDCTTAQMCDPRSKDITNYLVDCRCTLPGTLTGTPIATVVSGLPNVVEISGVTFSCGATVGCPTALITINDNLQSTDGLRSPHDATYFFVR
jgi:hypothetical protein